MQAEMDQPENRDIKEAELTWAGKHYYRGVKQGRDEGRIELRRQDIADLAGPFELELTPERMSRLSAMTLPELDALWKHLIAHRAWPASL